ncbi:MULTISPECIES: zinc ribbon domain-containing protein [unclassified Microcoleus]
MPLKNRAHVCPDCAHTADRNLNAAKNIERWFERIFILWRSHKSTS